MHTCRTDRAVWGKADDRGLRADFGSCNKVQMHREEWK